LRRYSDQPTILRVTLDDSKTDLPWEFKGSQYWNIDDETELHWDPRNEAQLINTTLEAFQG
jgi:hypothetical protein